MIGVQCIINYFFCCLKTVCHLLRTGVAAVFGPQSSQTASHVQSICDTMEVIIHFTLFNYKTINNCVLFKDSPFRN